MLKGLHQIAYDKLIVQSYEGWKNSIWSQKNDKAQVKEMDNLKCTRYIKEVICKIDDIQS